MDKQPLILLLHDMYHTLDQEHKWPEQSCVKNWKNAFLTFVESYLKTMMELVEFYAPW